MLQDSMIFQLAVVALMAGCVASSPPASSVYNQSSTPAVGASSPAVPPPLAIAATSSTTINGVIRYDNLGVYCDKIVAIHPNGGVDQMCFFEREAACGIRRLGPNGEELSRSDLAPGKCGIWVPRRDGGGYLVTLEAAAKSVAVTSIDEQGKRVAATQLASKQRIYPEDALLAADGGVVLSLQFEADMRYGSRQLAKSKYSTWAVVHFPATLNRLGWVKLFDSRRTQITALMPGLRDNVDAVVNTRGPLVPGAPMHPKVNPEDGSIYGGDTYGWKAARVTLDASGKQVAAADLGLAADTMVSAAAQRDDMFAMVSASPKNDWRNTLTTQRSGQEPQQLEIPPLNEIQTVNNRTWLLTCDRNRVDTKYVGACTAREIGGANAQIQLGPYDPKGIQWHSVAVHDDHIAAIGTVRNEALKMDLMVTALAQGNGSSIDPSRLTPLDRIGGTECGGTRLRPDEIVTKQLITQLAPQIAACGIAENSNAGIATYAAGGLRVFNVQGATPVATACVRKLFEGLFTCVATNYTHSFQLR